jgi:hypothetical protein
MPQQVATVLGRVNENISIIEESAVGQHRSGKFNHFTSSSVMLSALYFILS